MNLKDLLPIIENALRDYDKNEPNWPIAYLQQAIELLGKSQKIEAIVFDPHLDRVKPEATVKELKKEVTILVAVGCKILFGFQEAEK